jgi:hypothetical protein
MQRFTNFDEEIKSSNERETPHTPPSTSGQYSTEPEREVIKEKIN